MTGWNVASALAGFMIGVFFSITQIADVEKRDAARGYTYMDKQYFKLVPVIPTPPEKD